MVRSSTHVQRNNHQVVPSRGYGFIKEGQDDKETFVHESEFISKGGWSQIEIGTAVAFRIISRPMAGTPVPRSARWAAGSSQEMAMVAESAGENLKGLRSKAPEVSGPRRRRQACIRLFAATSKTLLRLPSIGSCLSRAPWPKPPPGALLAPLWPITPLTPLG